MKTVTVKVWQEGQGYSTFVDKVTRPNCKGSVCYQNKIYELMINPKGEFFILIPDDGFPWESKPILGNLYEAEFDRLVGWFCKNREEIEKVLHIEDLLITDDGVWGRRPGKNVRNPLSAIMAFLNQNPYMRKIT